MNDEDDFDPESVPDDWEPDEETLAELEYERNAPNEEDIQWVIDHAAEFIQPSTKNPGTESTEKASRDVKRSSTADKLEQQMLDARDAAVTRLREDNDRRRTMFRFIICAATVPVLVASGTMIWLLFDGKATELEVSAYFGSVVIQVIGLAVIVTKHLFPENGTNGELPSAHSSN